MGFYTNHPFQGIKRAFFWVKIGATLIIKQSKCLKWDSGAW